MTSEELFVWIHLPGSHEPVVAGRMIISHPVTGANIGKFTYGRSYIERSNAIPIDPVTLPLHGEISDFTTLLGYPGVILDSTPEMWGRKVIDKLMGQHTFPHGYLLINDVSRAGCLAYSTSPTEPPVELSNLERTVFSLSDLAMAAESVESDREIDAALLRALATGSGGARPKCTIIEDGAVWIAKFPSTKDSPLISIPRLEHASMTLARLCGINAAETKLIREGGKDICLVKRFDRELVDGKIIRNGFLSANSVFYADPGFSAIGTGSYARLARWLGRYGASSDQRKEIYRRMVFNVAIRNSDDHERNHGLLQRRDGYFDLSKAYDVLPAINPTPVHTHSMLIGETADGTVSNLLSNASAFGLDAEEARALIEDIQAKIAHHLHEVFYESGFGDEDMARVEKYFRKIPASIEEATNFTRPFRIK